MLLCEKCKEQEATLILAHIGGSLEYVCDHCAWYWFHVWTSCNFILPVALTFEEFKEWFHKLHQDRDELFERVQQLQAQLQTLQTKK